MTPPARRRAYLQNLT